MKDHKIIADHGTTALLDRSSTGAPEPYVIAYHYDSLTGVWSCGEYFADRKEATIAFMKLAAGKK